MSSTPPSRLFHWSLFVAVLVVAGNILLLPHLTATAASGPNPLTGFAWSAVTDTTSNTNTPTMGWISFNDPTGGSLYGVYEDNNGNLSGYAWSSNLGWVDFNGSTADGAHPAPRVIPGTGYVTGWARACAAFSGNACSGDMNLDPNSGGWDGWIDLSWIIQDKTTCNWSGYAWGSDGIGWISMSDPSGSLYGITGGSAVCTALYTPPTVDFYASPNPIDSGQSSTLYWTSDAASCIGFGFSTGIGDPANGSVSTGPLTIDSPYTITCTGTNGLQTTKGVTVKVNTPVVSISANPTRVRVNTPSSISWSASGVKHCKVSGPSGPPLANGPDGVPPDSSGDFTTGSPQSITITRQSKFTIDCQGTHGSRVTKSVIVNVLPIFQNF